MFASFVELLLYLQVRPTGIDKGVMVDHMISLLNTNSGGIDFVLCIGDDAASLALDICFTADAWPL